MIAKLKEQTTEAGVGGLLAYLFGPGRVEEHTDQRVVAASDEVGLSAVSHRADGRCDIEALTGWMTELDVWAQVELGARPASVMHVSMSVPPADGELSDNRWREAAEELMRGLGLDESGVRWVAVRHGRSAGRDGQPGNDHIHVAAVMVDEVGQRVHVDFSRLKARAVCRALEDRWGLTVTAAAGDTGVAGYTHAERSRAAGQSPVREHLQRQVRVAASVTRDFAAMARMLAERGIVMEPRHVRADGSVGGVAFGDLSYRTAAGETVMFSGRSLGRDLTLPQLQARWDAVAAAEALPVEQTVEVVDRMAAAIQAGAPDADQVAAVAADHLAVVAELVEPNNPAGQMHQAARLAARLGTSSAGRTSAVLGPDAALLRIATFSTWTHGKARVDGLQLIVAAARLMQSTARLRQSENRLANAHAAARAYGELASTAREVQQAASAVPPAGMAASGPVPTDAALRRRMDDQRYSQGKGRGR